MPGTDNDSAINVHLCRNDVPGMSAAEPDLSPLIELRVSAALFCFEFFSSTPNHAEFRTWKLKTLLSQAKALQTACCTLTYFD